MDDNPLTLPKQHPNLAKRFRGYLPVIIDIETAGFNPKTDAILEIAIRTIVMTEEHLLEPHETYFYHLKPFAGANLTKKCLEFTGIDPDHPFRFAIEEGKAITHLFKIIRKHVHNANCQRAILVGHNPSFDLSFMQAAVTRHNIKRVPFHPFSTIDTASLSALALGQTVLARAAGAAKIPFNTREAHSAIYDAEKNR